MHTTLKLDQALPSLRDSALLPVVEQGLRDSKEREGFRLVHYSIQEHHLHLIVEAKDTPSLGRGMQGLAIRLAKRINRALGTRGRIFIDRYFARILKTPRETRATLLYVINNARRHAYQRGERLSRGWVDDRSSGRYFDGWRPPIWPPPRNDVPPVVPARTWLLTKGWRRSRGGLLHPDEVPGPMRGAAVGSVPLGRSRSGSALGR